MVTWNWVLPPLDFDNFTCKMFFVFGAKVSKIIKLAYHHTEEYVSIYSFFFWNIWELLQTSWYLTSVFFSYVITVNVAVITTKFQRFIKCCIYYISTSNMSLKLIISLTILILLMVLSSFFQWRSQDPILDHISHLAITAFFNSINLIYHTCLFNMR